MHVNSNTPTNEMPLLPGQPHASYIYGMDGAQGACVAETCLNLMGEHYNVKDLWEKKPRCLVRLKATIEPGR